MNKSPIQDLLDYCNLWDYPERQRQSQTNIQRYMFYRRIEIGWHIVSPKTTIWFRPAFEGE